MEIKLAIEGGKPVRDKYLSYGRQCIDEADINLVNEVLRGDYLTTGPYVKNFEERVAEYVGAKYGVAVSNGTAALHAAAYAAGIKNGDEVIVPAISFAATSNCVLYLNGTPVFVDVDYTTGNIDIDKIEAAITPKTKAIIPVDLAGHAVDMDRIMEIADKHNLIVIEDAAHALGSEYKEKKLGTRAHMTEFSFHPVKPITTAEGGMVVTDDERLYNILSKFRTHGITRDSKELLENHGKWYYEMQFLGYNYRLPDMNAALGYRQMDKLDSFLKRRREIAKKYLQAFKDLEEIDLPYEGDYSKSGWHIFIIRLKLDRLKVSRKEVFDALQAENIGVNVHYIPIYYHPYYKELGYKKGICPVAEKYYDSIITLPIFPAMEDKDIEDVILAVEKVINHYRK